MRVVPDNGQVMIRPLQADEHELVADFLSVSSDVPPEVESSYHTRDHLEFLADLVECLGRPGIFAVAAENYEGRLEGVAWSPVEGSVTIDSRLCRPVHLSVTAARCCGEHDKGIAAALMDTLIARLTKSGCGEAFLVAPKGAMISLCLQRFGFEVGAYEDGDALGAAKLLP